MKIKKLKKEVRVIGIDDGPFQISRKSNTIIVGTVYRGGEFLDGVLSRKIVVDGLNSTAKIIEMINSSKWKKSLQCIFLDGIAVGGFNVIDIKKINEKTQKPVIVVMRSYPDLNKIFKTLKKIGMEKKIKLIENAGEIHKVGKIFIQFIGLNKKKAFEFVRLTTKNALIPEPLRIAHIIASGIVKGESYGSS